MLDFNPQRGCETEVTALIDAGLQQQRAAEPPRTYLGASCLGVACTRALQYEYAATPVDHGRAHDGRLLRIFTRGHVMETCMAQWLRQAGFLLQTEQADGTQYGFSAVEGRLQGHIDGVIIAGPEGFAYPMLWENKCVGAKTFRAFRQHPLAVSHPVYAGQMAVYQAYLNLHAHPALFTALNADTMEIYAERVAFDAVLAQRLSDRALLIITATQAGEQLPRTFSDSTHFECRLCAWQDRCWRH